MWKSRNVLQYGAILRSNPLSNKFPRNQCRVKDYCLSSPRVSPIVGSIRIEVPALVHRDFSSSQNKSSRKSRKNRAKRVVESPEDHVVESSSRVSHKERAQMIFCSFVNQINALQGEIDSLPTQPAIWSTNTVTNNDDIRRDIFERAKAVVQELEDQIENVKFIRPSDRHRTEVSALMEKFFKLYSLLSSPQDDLSVFDECQRLVRLMEGWNIEMQPNHYDHVVLAAARQNKWQQASDLYWKYIDPDSAGYRPCTISVSNPLGLYVIARAAQEKDIPVVESVFDAVLRMCMVSPSDQEKYVLAAGTAIGRAGEWEQMIDYLKTSYNAASLGQPLVAAVMQACLLCDRYNEALDIFDEQVKEQKVGGEWLWAGGQDMLHPQCRDLAMRAMGGSTRSDLSTRALQLFHEVQNEEGRAISAQALYGVVSTFENEGNWEAAVDFFFTLMNTPNLLSRVVSGDKLDLSTDVTTSENSTLDTELLGCLELTLIPVLRACNASGQFGVALLCMHILSAFCRTTSGTSLGGAEVKDFQSLSLLLDSSPYKQDLLIAAVTSLCGVGSYKSALDLFDTVGPPISKSESPNGSTFADTSELYEWIRARSRRMELGLGRHDWDLTLQEVDRIVLACDVVRGERKPPSGTDMHLLSSVVASCIRSSINGLQPEMGVFLGKWWESTFVNLNENDFPCLFLEGVNGCALPLTDSYLASAVAVFNAVGKHDEALSLVDSHLFAEGSSGPRKDWISSYQEAVGILLSKGHSDALPRFHEAIAVHRNPDIFCTVARGLAEQEDWKGVADIYRLALTSGCLSEELSLLAMKSVVSGRLNRRIRILRNIVNEIARFVGTTPSAWVALKYWSIKRLLGFNDARNLMWWEDVKSAHLDELELALDVFESRLANGFTPKRDVLRRIVASAGSFNKDVPFVPSERTGLPRVPRSVEDWVDVISRVLKATEDTAIQDHPDFVKDVSVALKNLGLDRDCLDFVMRAITRGVHVPKPALDAAAEASKRIDDPLVYDLAMMTLDRSETSGIEASSH